MRHVDDGTIHAWLDGQVTDRAEAAWIDEHLRWCAACAARVVEERGILEQATALLSTAAPVAEAPPFDEVAAQAARLQESQTGSGRETRASRFGTGDSGLARFGRQRRLLQLGWAASLVLAAGIGWLVRDMALGRPPASVVAEAPALPPRAALADDAQASGAAGVVAPAQPEAPPSPDGMRRSASAPTQEAPGREARAAAPAEGDERATAAADALSPPPTAREASSADVQQESGVAAAPPAAGAREETPALRAPGSAANAAGQAFVAAEAGRPAPAPLTEPIAVSAAPAAQAGSVQARSIRGPAAPPPAAAADASSWRQLPRTEAAARSGMALYGLEDMEAVLTAISPDNGSVRTVYRLPSGATAELFQERASVPASAAALESLARAAAQARTGAVANIATTPRTWSEVRGDVRVTLRTASVSEDVNALAARLRVE